MFRLGNGVVYLSIGSALFFVSCVQDTCLTNTLYCMMKAPEQMDRVGLPVIAFPHSVLRQAVIGIGACHGMEIVYIGFDCTLSTRASSQSESTLFPLKSACYIDRTLNSDWFA